MKKYVMTALVAALASSAALVAHAGHHKGDGPKYERKSAEEVYKMIDADGNGSITLEEFKTHHDAMKAKWKEKREEWKAKKKEMKSKDHDENGDDKAE
jgi:hypothetical protein